MSIKTSVKFKEFVNRCVAFAGRVVYVSDEYKELLTEIEILEDERNRANMMADALRESTKEIETLRARVAAFEKLGVKI